MANIGVVTLKLDPHGAYLAKFLKNLKEVSGMDINVFDYKLFNSTTEDEIAAFMNSSSMLVLSPGDAPIGLATPERIKEHPAIGKIYDLVRTSVDKGVPVLGSNAGHLALNCAYDWAIAGVPEGYTGKHKISLTGDDPIFEGIETLAMNITDSIRYAVLSLEAQATRDLQDRIAPLAKHLGRPLISKVNSESGAPVYGIHPNIQPGTEKLYGNFFQLALQYIEAKKG